MTDLELQEIALRMVEKGYCDHDTIRYCDDLYDATTEEKEKCLEFVDEVIEGGTAVYRANLNL